MPGSNEKWWKSGWSETYLKNAAVYFAKESLRGTRSSKKCDSSIVLGRCVAFCRSPRAAFTDGSNGTLQTSQVGGRGGVSQQKAVCSLQNRSA